MVGDTYDLNQQGQIKYPKPIEPMGTPTPTNPVNPMVQPQTTQPQQGAATPLNVTPDQEEREWRQIFGKLPVYQQTKLNPRQEREFQTWFKSLPWYANYTQRTGQAPNMNDPMYDYRGAFASNMGPDETGHWRSVNPMTGRPLKNPKHDTWWKEEFVAQQGGANTDQPNQEVIDMVDKFKNRGEALAYLRSLALNVYPDGR